MPRWLAAKPEHAIGWAIGASPCGFRSADGLCMGLVWQRAQPGGGWVHAALPEVVDVSWHPNGVVVTPWPRVARPDGGFPLVREELRESCDQGFDVVRLRADVYALRALMAGPSGEWRESSGAPGGELIYVWRHDLQVDDEVEWEIAPAGVAHPIGVPPSLWQIRSHADPSRCIQAKGTRLGLARCNSAFDRDQQWCLDAC